MSRLSFANFRDFRIPPWSRLDHGLILITLALVSVGVVMVASSSVAVADSQYQNAYFHLIRHLVYLLVAGLVVVFLLATPLEEVRRWSWLLMVAALVLLVAVLLPGIGRTVNFSTRWLGVGPITIQVSEFAKLFTLLFIADYLTRRQHEMDQHWWGFMKPLLLVGVVAFLLLLEPDFGAVVVLTLTIFGMVFLQGVRLGKLLVVMLAALPLAALLAVVQPYRLQRLVAYMDPWSDQFDTGYQLTQALIAFGRGEWFGVGLGNSMQKLFYLPEAHTDFVFAILCEELGLVGGMVVVTLFLGLILRGLWIGRQAERRQRPFHSCVAYGLSLLLAIQIFVSLGVNTGLLPTKGLTLPLVSYGGSSLLVSLMIVALLLRVDLEIRHSESGEPVDPVPGPPDRYRYSHG